jgi:hypothetical protein
MKSSASAKAIMLLSNKLFARKEKCASLKTAQRGAFVLLQIRR